VDSSLAKMGLELEDVPSTVPSVCLAIITCVGNCRKTLHMDAVALLLLPLSCFCF
jgi:hypothetical protein